MMLKYKFFSVELSTESWAGHSIFYVVNRKAKSCLGRIVFYPAWKQWVLCPDAETVWSDGCLTDIQDAIKQISAKSREGL